MHPLQTFPTVQAAIAKLPGSYCFIEGDARACAVLESLAKAIGALPVRIAPETKALYHAGAAVASNYLVTLLDAAAAMVALAMGGSDDAERARALAALAPLVKATMENALQLGPERADRADRPRRCRYRAEAPGGPRHGRPATGGDVPADGPDDGGTGREEGVDHDPDRAGSSADSAGLR